MSEQQRVFVAVALCLLILLVWQTLTPKKAQPPPEKKPATAAEEQPASPSPDKPAITTEALQKAPPEALVEAVVVPETQRDFETERFVGQLSNRHASLRHLQLTKYNERPPDDKTPPVPVSLVNVKQEGSEIARQARIEWNLGRIEPPQLEWQQTEAQVPGFSLAGKTASGVETHVRVVPREDAYALDYEIWVENGSASTIPVNVTLELALEQTVKIESGWFAPPAGKIMGLCSVEGSVERLDTDDLKEDGPFESPSPAAWAGIDRQYFVVAVLPTEPDHGNCKISVAGDVTTMRFSYDLDAVQAGATWMRRLTLYVGPKRDQDLTAVSPFFGDVIDYSWGIPLGFLARPMVFLLNLFHDWTTSWGVAIMMLTLLVKLLLFPVTYKSLVSMRKMQQLRPELDTLKKKYEGDRERQQMEQMKLFKEKGVNPLGGCLPMLLQMPVWVALYRTLWSSVDLYQQRFLWLTDLTAKEPLPIMALLVGALMFLQQKITPTSVDSQQAKIMMYGMPIMFTFFMLQMPSGLVLYILTNSVLTIFQQLAINKRLPQPAAT